MEQQLPAGLGERQVAELVEDDEVETCQMIGQASLPASPAFGLEPVDQIDGVEEPAARSTTNAAARDRDRQMRLARAGRTSVILPGVWCARSGFDIRSIREAVNSS